MTNTIECFKCGRQIPYDLEYYYAEFDEYKCIGECSQEEKETKENLHEKVSKEIQRIHSWAGISSNKRSKNYIEKAKAFIKNARKRTLSLRRRIIKQETHSEHVLETLQKMNVRNIDWKEIYDLIDMRGHYKTRIEVESGGAYDDNHLTIANVVDRYLYYYTIGEMLMRDK